MEVKHISRDELMHIFIEVSLDNLLLSAFPEALERNVPKLPKAEQKHARKQIELLKRNPQILAKEFYEQRHKDTPIKTEPIDYESESYKSYMKLCDSLISYYNDNQDIIAETYKQAYLESGIDLIID